MLQIFVSHGEVIEVLEETNQPQPKRLQERIDYEVEYIDGRRKFVLEGVYLNIVWTSLRIYLSFLVAKLRKTKEGSLEYHETDIQYEYVKELLGFLESVLKAV